MRRAWQQTEVQTVILRAARLAAFVQLHPDADAAAVERKLQSMGVQVRSRTGTVMSLRLQRSLLVNVADLAEVRRLEGVRPLPQRLFKSVPTTGASVLRTQTPPYWQGLTGRGVIIGIVDSGFDFLHPSPVCQPKHEPTDFELT